MRQNTDIRNIVTRLKRRKGMLLGHSESNGATLGAKRAKVKSVGPRGGPFASLMLPQQRTGLPWEPSGAWLSPPTISIPPLAPIGAQDATQCLTSQVRKATFSTNTTYKQGLKRSCVADAGAGLPLREGPRPRRLPAEKPAREAKGQARGGG